MRVSSAAISRAISAWIAAAVFFLGRQSILHRTRTANLLVHLQQVAAQFPEVSILSNLVLSLAQRRRGGEGFRDRLAASLASEAVKGAMAGIVLLMAMTSLVAASAAGSRNRAGAHIAQSGDLLLDGSALCLQRGKRVGHRASFST